MKTVTIIGASGFIGSAILKEALLQGYQVKAIVRNPEKVTVSSPRLTVVKADIMDESNLVDLLAGEKRVISAYNPGWANPHIYDDTLKGYPIILRAAKQAGVKRLLIVGGAGTLFIAPDLRLIDSDVIPVEYVEGAKSLGCFYLNTLMNENEMDWVFFSPPAKIAPGERTGKYRLGKDELIVDDKGESNISVEDYALAMIDELETPKHHQERFTIGY